MCSFITHLQLLVNNNKKENMKKIILCVIVAMLIDVLIFWLGLVYFNCVKNYENEVETSLDKTEQLQNDILTEFLIEGRK